MEEEAEVMSATQIWERLWVGSIFDAEGLANSNPQGISVVRFSREAMKDKAAKMSGLQPVVAEAPVECLA